MAYAKTNWVDKVTPLNPANMNNIENGIAANDTAIETLNTNKFDKANIKNDAITTDAGYALDARQANPNVAGSLASKRKWTLAGTTTGPTTRIAFPDTDWEEVCVKAIFGLNGDFGFVFNINREQIKATDFNYLQGAYTSATDYHRMSIAVSTAGVALKSWFWYNQDALATSKIEVYVR